MDIEYNSRVSTTIIKEQWYRNWKFPLIPIMKIIEPDQYNTWWFSFKWLFLTIWSLDSPSFEIAIVASTHWGIGVTAIVPYTRIVLCIPCPMFVENFIHKYFYRKPNKP